VVPLIVGVYWWLLRRRRRQAVRYSSVALLRSVLPRRKRWQRHLPIALLLGGIAALCLAAGRPHVERDVPFARTSIILALDVSGSMCSTDVEPNRLAVAQQAPASSSATSRRIRWRSSFSGTRSLRRAADDRPGVTSQRSTASDRPRHGSARPC
jgi:hypothetical protein